MFNSVSANAYVKRTYDPKFIENSLTSVSDTTLKAVTKKTDGSGEQLSYMADVDDNFGVSVDFVASQTAASTSTSTVGSKFLVDWANASEVAQLTSDIIGKTRQTDGAWQKALDMAMRKKLNAFAHFNSIQLQGKGWGEIGSNGIQAVSGSTFVPGVRSDISKFVKGMPLVFAQTLNTAVLRSATPLYITGVSYTLGSELVTCSASMASVGAVNGDFVFIQGCRQNSATPARVCPIGMGAYIPNQLVDLADATITTLGGVDRTTNSRLYGTFIDATGGGSLLGALIDGAQEAITIGNAKRLEMFCSRANFALVAKDLNNAVRYDGNPGEKTIGTTRLKVYADGQAEAYLQVSRTTNDNQVWGFDPSSVILRSIGGAPHIESDDGLTMGRVSNAAAWEVRWFQQANFEFTNPASDLRIQLV